VLYAADFTGLVQSFKLPRINPNVLLPLPIVLSQVLAQFSWYMFMPERGFRWAINWISSPELQIIGNLADKFFASTKLI
jgi:hypothetical protein